MDLEMKQKAIAKAKPLGEDGQKSNSLKITPDLIEWLESL